VGAGNGVNEGQNAVGFSNDVMNGRVRWVLAMAL
jgi:hypothetical protein